VPRLRWIGFQLAAQLRDVNVHCARHHLDAVTPDFSQQLHAGRYGAAATNQGQE
jgi:hypothetical protein